MADAKLYETMLGKTFAVLWRDEFSQRLGKYLTVLNDRPAGMLYVQGATEDGQQDGDPFWLSASAIVALRPI